jgi:predicted O-methyltransferase YrrM
MASKLLSKIFRRFGYDLLPVGKLEQAYFAGVIPYANKDQTKMLDECRPYTQTTRENTFALIRATEYLVRKRVPGAYVECGVWKGGSAMAMAMTLDHLQESRDIYLFDTFEGMPPGTSVDIDLEGNDERWYREESDLYIHAGKGSGWNAISIDEVKMNLDRLSPTRQRFHFVKGCVEDTLPLKAPEQIALLRLDTDFYASTRHELEHLYPRLVSGGIIIIDDYGHFLGARKAVDDYIAGHRLEIFMHRIDYTAIMWIKP